MTEFVSGIVEVFTTLFGGLIDAISAAGGLIFTINAETGAITGVAAFGWILAALIGIPLATWLFGKLLGLLNKLTKKA